MKKIIILVLMMMIVITNLHAMVHIFDETFLADTMLKTVISQCLHPLIPKKDKDIITQYIATAFKSTSFTKFSSMQLSFSIEENYFFYRGFPFLMNPSFDNAKMFEGFVHAIKFLDYIETFPEKLAKAIERSFNIIPQNYLYNVSDYGYEADDEAE